MSDAKQSRKQRRKERAKRIVRDRLHLTDGHMRHATTVRNGVLVSVVVFVSDDVIDAHEVAHP